MANDSDVDLEALLSESGDVTTPRASTETGTTQPASEGVTTPESERENQRVRDLADKVKILEAALAERSNNTESSTNDRSVAQPSDIKSLLESRVTDPASREVLLQMADMLEKNIESKYAPNMSSIQSMRAESEFSALEAKIPGLSVYKNEVMKSLSNKPGASLKSLVGEILIDKQLSKIKPTETQGSTIQREQPDLDDMSLDELYDQLGAK